MKREAQGAIQYAGAGESSSRSVASLMGHPATFQGRRIGHPGDAYRAGRIVQACIDAAAASADGKYTDGYGVATVRRLDPCGKLDGDTAVRLEVNGRVVGTFWWKHCVIRINPGRPLPATVRVSWVGGEAVWRRAQEH